MGKMYQIQTAFAASFSCFVMGLLNVWPSYTINQYTAINGTILNSPMSEFESSFLGSAPSLGAIFGTAVVSITIDNLGRKKGGVIIALPAVLSWAIIDISSSSLPILAARFLGGISGGAGLVFAPIFISEVVEDSIRGMLASTPMVCYCSGALISYLLGWFSSYHTIIRFNIAVCVLSAVLLMLVKESPVFLLKKNREEDAREAIAHYRGATTASKIVLEELSRLKLQVMPGVEMITVTAPDEEAEKEVLNPNHDISPQEQSQKQPAWKKLFVSPSSRRAFTVVGTVLTLQVLMGMIAVQVYAKDLFAAAAPDLIPDLCSVLLAVILLAGCTVAGAIADKAGRRPLQVSSCVMSGACMVFMGVLLQTSFAPPWLTAVMVLLFCLSFNFGAGTVPYVLIAEVFVPEVQGIASTILIEWVWFLNFFIIQVFPTLLSLMGLHGAFYLFGIVGFVNAVVSYYIVPETKGLSNEQVQDAFRRKK